MIEGDIKGCFDNIDHHLLMQRVRQHCADLRVNRLLVQFLKADRAIWRRGESKRGIKLAIN